MPNVYNGIVGYNENNLASNDVFRRYEVPNSLCFNHFHNLRISNFSNTYHCSLSFKVSVNFLWACRKIYRVNVMHCVCSGMRQVGHSILYCLLWTLAINNETFAGGKFVGFLDFTWSVLFMYICTYIFNQFLTILHNNTKQKQLKY